MEQVWPPLANTISREGPSRFPHFIQPCLLRKHRISNSWLLYIITQTDDTFRRHLLLASILWKMHVDWCLRCYLLVTMKEHVQNHSTRCSNQHTTVVCSIKQSTNISHFHRINITI